MTLRRGFKAEAAELASEIRAELRLGARDRLDPFQLARHLDIPVVRLSALLSSSRGAHYLLTEEPESFSGLTVLRGCYRMIVPQRLPQPCTSEQRSGARTRARAAVSRACASTRCRNWAQTLERHQGAGGELARGRVARDPRDGARRCTGACQQSRRYGALGSKRENVEVAP